MDKIFLLLWNNLKVGAPQQFTLYISNRFFSNPASQSVVSKCLNPSLASNSKSKLNAVRSVQLILGRLADAINEGRHASNEQRGRQKYS